MNLGNSIRHGAAWLFVGGTASQILSFALGVVLARLLVPEDFGTLVTVHIFTGLAGFVAGGGMGQALIRAKEARDEDFQVVFTIQLMLGVLVYLAFFATAPMFAQWYRNALYTDLMRVSAASFLLRPFLNLPTAWMTREMRFKQRAIIELICAALGGGLSVALAWQHFGVWSLVLGGLTGSALSIVALMAITPVRPRFRFNSSLAKKLGLYAVKVTSNDLAGYIRNQTPNFVLGHLQGPSIVGLFNKADSLAKTPRMVAGSVYDPVFRSLAKVQGNKNQSQYIYFRTITLLSVYMLPLFVALSWLARPFVAFFYGPKWLPSAEPLAILSAVGFFACIGYPSGAVLAARNWLGREVFVHLTQIALFAASCIIGIHWGLPGVALGIFVSEGLSVLFIAVLVRSCLDARASQFAGCLAPGLLLNLILCGAFFVADFLLPSKFGETWPFFYILFMSIIGAVVYIAAFLGLPIPSLAKEGLRWKMKIRTILSTTWAFWK